MTNWHKTGRQGWGLGSTLGSTKRGRRNATAQPCLVTDSHRLALTVICYTLNRSTHHHNMLPRVLSRLSLNLAERAVLHYVRKNPGKQLFQINAATLKSHHSWGTKSVLSDLERHGRIDVVRFRACRVKGEITVKRIKPLYFIAD